MSESAEVTPPRSRLWLEVGVATVIAVAASASFWWLAVPRYDLCTAILPAPAGCRIADRVPAATLWTAIVAVLYVATCAVTVTRPRDRRWPSAVAIAVLIVAALWGYRAVLYSV